MGQCCVGDIEEECRRTFAGPGAQLMKSLALRPKRILAAWRRLTVCLARLSKCRRLWNALGTYLSLIKQRGRVETDQQPNGQKQDDQLR